MHGILRSENVVSEKVAYENKSSALTGGEARRNRPPGLRDEVRANDALPNPRGHDARCEVERKGIARER